MSISFEFFIFFGTLWTTAINKFIDLVAAPLTAGPIIFMITACWRCGFERKNENTPRNP